MSTDSKIITSWVIRTKNEERHIGEILDILFKQTRQDFEIIIVDSGSTDKTLKIIEKYPVKLVEIKSEDFNYSYSLNLGISKTKGKYIGILSGHSVPQSLVFQADALKFFSNSTVAAVTGYYVDGIRKFAKPMMFIQNKFQGEQHHCPWMTNTNSMIRKDLWNLYPFDERLTRGCEDYDWAVEMLSRNYDVIKTPLFSTIYYRVNGKPSYWKMKPVWDQICKELDQKKRPSKSFSTINIT